MTNKQTIEKYHKLNLLWCSKCLKQLTPRDVWLSDNTGDNRLFCLNCAPDTAIRAYEECVGGTNTRNGYPAHYNCHKPGNAPTWEELQILRGVK
uniref:Uncharacterized protein n=1 Tax=viral metagenome TaxID=1070528 RepID=A0A6M3IXL8_9ZZZZ